MSVLHAVISKYADVDNISSSVVSIHFRKFVSKKLLANVLQHSRVRKISFSKYASNRISHEEISKLLEKGISVNICSLKGRPTKLSRSLIFLAKKRR